MITEQVDQSIATVDRRKRNRPGRSGRRAIQPDADYSGDEQRKVERRRHIDPTTCERDYSGDEIEFMKAMDEYKRKSGRQFPTWSEVLEVIRCIGYRKIAEPTEISGR